MDLAWYCSPKMGIKLVWWIDFVGKIEIENWQIFYPEKKGSPANPNPSTNSRN